MPIDTKTRTILSKILNFSSNDIEQLEENPAILTRTLSLLDIIRKTPGKKEKKILARNRLHEIRQNLNNPDQSKARLLQKARAEYYSFQKIS